MIKENHLIATSFFNVINNNLLYELAKKNNLQVKCTNLYNYKLYGYHCIDFESKIYHDLIKILCRNQIIDIIQHTDWIENEVIILIKTTSMQLSNFNNVNKLEVINTINL